MICDPIRWDALAAGRAESVRVLGERECVEIVFGRAAADFFEGTDRDFLDVVSACDEAFAFEFAHRVLDRSPPAALRERRAPRLLGSPLVAVQEGFGASVVA